MSSESWVQLIKQVAEEQGFEVSKGVASFTINIDKWHSVAYQLKINSAGYVQAHQWEGDEESSAWGRAVYSIRSFSDAVIFCQILINSSSIRGNRKSFS